MKLHGERNREVYRVTKEQMSNEFQLDYDLIKIWDMIEKKLYFLEFQFDFIDRNKNKLAYLLQNVIDENQIVKIIPKDLDSFFKVCFILDNMNKIPKNANIWLIYLLSYFNSNITLENIAQIVYCIDFLYSKISLKENELEQLKKTTIEILKKIKNCFKENGSYYSSKLASPLEETRYALFSINLIEDLIQDLIFYYSITEIPPIKKIYENISDIEKTYKFIKH